MEMLNRLDAFVRDAATATSETELTEILREISCEIGFSFFALTHHVDIPRAPQPKIRLSNYPSDWVEYFDARRLGVSDPVHRASHLTSVGFAWSRLPQLIGLTPRDHEVLELARNRGIGDGFTVPANVPGESHGSCSFAMAAGASLLEDRLAMAQLVGAFAFEAARRLARVRSGSGAPVPRLTDRQRDCVFWAARGKTDWEISRILGLSHETVIQYLKRARERYGVTKRGMLAIHALYDGTISFNDVFSN
jgi:LuxR family quorum-sensing system transcriptional regulator CciR